MERRNLISLQRSSHADLPSSRPVGRELPHGFEMQFFFQPADIVDQG